MVPSVGAVAVFPDLYLVVVWVPRSASAMHGPLTDRSSLFSYPHWIRVSSASTNNQDENRYSVRSSVCEDSFITLTACWQLHLRWKGYFIYRQEIIKFEDFIDLLLESVICCCKLH